MSRLKVQGRLFDIARSFVALNAIAIATICRRLVRKPIVQSWSTSFEIGVLFWRHQFRRALAMANPAAARAYFDSLQTETDEVLDVTAETVLPPDPPGTWFQPSLTKQTGTLLHFHGGGYSFSGGISRRFAELLAHTLGMDVFAPDYRLTPENPHPAQLEDAVAAYRYLLARGIEPGNIVVSGDSAGGHLALMVLIALKETGLPQPSLAIGMCPWTDIGARGASLFGNDRYDLVQGEMTLEFGRRLRGDTGLSDRDLSPIYQDFRSTAPVYLQAGNREILVDMIRDFAVALESQRVPVMLDVWQDMIHNFQAHGSTLRQSAEALRRIADVIADHVGTEGVPFQRSPQTEICRG